MWLVALAHGPADTVLVLSHSGLQSVSRQQKPGKELCNGKKQKHMVIHFRRVKGFP